jgi:N-acetylglucosaminyl-diphospho-decaprenol L-rhamnosyltransferase
VLRPGKNLGYSRAANLGIAATRASLAAVLNPDLELAPGSAAALADRFAADAGLGAAGPRLTNPDGSTYPSARSMPRTSDAVVHGLLGRVRPSNPASRRYRQLDADPDVARPVDWVSGAAIWLRRTALDAVGGWDEGYFLYVEDVDLCWRLRRAGWGIAYEPGGQALHVQGVSTARHPYRMIIEHHRSLLRFARKRFRGPRSVMLVFAGPYLAFRAGVELVTHALGGRPDAPRVGG